MTKAQEKLVTDNVRLAYYIAGQHLILPKDERESAALFGLTKAALTFKPELGNQFSTLAGRCITNEIRMVYRKYKLKKHEAFIPISHFEREGKDGVASGLLDYMGGTVDADCTIKDELDWLIKRAHLTDRELYIINSLVFQQKTQNVVAEELGYSRSWVSRQLYSGLDKIKGVMEKENVYTIEREATENAAREGKRIWRTGHTHSQSRRGVGRRVRSNNTNSEK